MSAGWPRNGPSTSRSSIALPTQDAGEPHWHSRLVPPRVERVGPPTSPAVASEVTQSLGKVLTEVVSEGYRISSLLFDVEEATQDLRQPSSQIYSLNCYFKVRAAQAFVCYKVILIRVYKGLL